MSLKKETKEVIDLNNIGSRIKWIRKQLKLKQSTVAKNVGIDYRRYTLREGGVRTVLVEEYLVLASFFDSLWDFKAPPMYKGKPVNHISLEFILFGTDNETAHIESVISKIPRQQHILSR